MRKIKIPSGELTNIPFLKKLAGFNKPLILSTGMANLSDVNNAVNTVSNNKDYPLILLVCTSEYPTPPKSVNILKLKSLANAFPGLILGFSDHTQGIEASIAATAPTNIDAIDKKIIICLHSSINPPNGSRQNLYIKAIPANFGTIAKKAVIAVGAPS